MTGFVAAQVKTNGAKESAPELIIGIQFISQKIQHISSAIRSHLFHLGFFSNANFNNHFSVKTEEHIIF